MLKGGDGEAAQRLWEAYFGRLVALARAEKNLELKKDIVSRLSNMKSKEAMDYLMELLK